MIPNTDALSELDQLRALISDGNIAEAPTLAIYLSNVKASLPASGLSPIRISAANSVIDSLRKECLALYSDATKMDQSDLWNAWSMRAISAIDELRAIIKKYIEYEDDPSRLDRRTIERIARILCGGTGSADPAYPKYRSGEELKQFFRSLDITGIPDLGSNSRTGWVISVLSEVSNEQLIAVVERLASRMEYDSESEWHSAVRIINETLAAEDLALSAGAHPKVERAQVQEVANDGAAAATLRPEELSARAVEELDAFLRNIPVGVRELLPENRYGAGTNKTRPTIEITDEYDLQDLVRAFLRMRYGRVISEDNVPSTAGKGGRVDFAIRGIKVFIELKVYKSETDWKSKMLADIESKIVRYASSHECNMMFVFIYDPEHKCREAAEIETQLTMKRTYGEKSIMLRGIVAPRLEFDVATGARQSEGSSIAI